MSIYLGFKNSYCYTLVTTPTCSFNGTNSSIPTVPFPFSFLDQFVM